MPKPKANSVTKWSTAVKKASAYYKKQKGKPGTRAQVMRLAKEIYKQKTKATKRKSTKRKSTKRKSTERKSTERKSTERKSTERNSTKRSSTKRKSTKRKSARKGKATSWQQAMRLASCDLRKRKGGKAPTRRQVIAEARRIHKKKK